MDFILPHVGIRTLDPYLLYLLGFEDARLNDEHAGHICFNYFHLNYIIKLSTLSMIDINIITNIIPKYNGAIDFEKYLLFVFTNPALSSSSVNSSF